MREVKNRFETKVDRTRQGAMLLQAYQGDKALGLLALYPPDAQGNRVVFQVWTLEDQRGIGVASHLWNTAKELGLNPVHSSNQTDAGVAWAQVVGS